MNSVSTITDSRIDRGAISGLESMMKAAIAAGATSDAVPQMRLEHSFVPGAYARQLWRPKGTLIVGKTHKHPCFNFLVSGRLTIWSEFETREIIAPAFWTSTGGLRRVTYAHEDSLLITVHGTNETDLDKLEAELTEDDEIPEWLEQTPVKDLIR